MRRSAQHLGPADAPEPPLLVIEHLIPARKPPDTDDANLAREAWRGFKILNLNFFSKQKHKHMNNYPSPPRSRSGPGLAAA